MGQGEPDEGGLKAVTHQNTKNGRTSTPPPPPPLPRPPPFPPPRSNATDNSN